MNNDTKDRNPDQTDEEILTPNISDDALEAAAETLIGTDPFTRSAVC